MATIGLLTLAASGHLNPMGALGRELVRRGHRVVVATIPEAEASVRAAGLEFTPIGAGTYPRGDIARIEGEMGKLAGRAAIKVALRTIAEHAAMLMDEAPAALRAAGVELLLVDQGSAGGGTVADRLGVPFVSVCNALVFNMDPDVPPPHLTWGPLRTPWGRLASLAYYMTLFPHAWPGLRRIAAQRRAWGLPPIAHPNDHFSPLAQISQQPPEFEFPRRSLPPHLHFAGPFIDPASRPPVPFPFERLDGRPLVYASLGTLQNRRLWIFRAIAEACAGLDAQLVLTLGGSTDPAELGALPGSPLVVRSAPQLELLKRARWTITHAGLNTALESLAQGVPMVAVPITNDQPGVAGRIAWTGTGLIVPPGQRLAERLRSGLERLRNDPSFDRNADRLRAAIARCGGVRRAAEVIERVLATGRPVRAAEFEGI